MALPNKLIAQVSFKAGGDIFHDLLVSRPHHLAKATPAAIQSCQLHQGNYGTNGSVLLWNYTLDIYGVIYSSVHEDGKAETAKHVVQDIDFEKKKVAFKMIEGDLCELYKNMLTTFHVETKNGIDFITWTIDYELITPHTPHPLSLLNFVIQFTKELETYVFG